MSGYGRAAVIATVGGFSVATLVTASILAWLSLLAGAHLSQGQACVPAITTNSQVPARFQPIFAAAADHYKLGAKGPTILAGIADVESGFGQNTGPSSAGAIGFMQFEPGTWAAYGVDADGDGRRDPSDPADAIFSAARYLRASGAPQDWQRAIFAYNHSRSYVDTVLANAASFSGGPTADAASCTAVAVPAPTGAFDVKRVTGGGAIVPIPGSPGMSIDSRILPDALYLIRTYHLTVTAGYAPTGHEPNGEHPLGLALDLVPGPGGTWDDVDRLAHLVEPEQNHPRPPFRWVGYNGDPGHGRGNHLHLSWNHAPTPTRQPPAAWVLVFV